MKTATAFYGNIFQKAGTCPAKAMGIFKLWLTKSTKGREKLSAGKHRLRFSIQNRCTWLDNSPILLFEIYLQLALSMTGRK